MLRWFSMFLMSSLVSVLGLAVGLEGSTQESCVDPVPVVEVIQQVVEQEPVEDMTVGCTFPHVAGYSAMVEAAANLHGINSRLLALTTYRESGCNVLALGAADEIGLTQVNPKVWVKKLIREGIITEQNDLWNPVINLQAGAYILSRNAKRAKGDAWGTLRRYNGAGPKARAYATAQVSSYKEFWTEEPWVVAK